MTLAATIETADYTCVRCKRDVLHGLTVVSNYPPRWRAYPHDAQCGRQCIGGGYRPRKPKHDDDCPCAGPGTTVGEERAQDEVHAYWATCDVMEE